MRDIRKIVIHCSASRPKASETQRASDIDAMHKARGWRKIGYHYFIRVDGMVEKGRDESEMGSGVLGHNKDSLHICYAGGLDDKGNPKDTRSPAQLLAMTKLVTSLMRSYPKAKVMGHRDLSPDKDRDGVVEKWEWLKDCPCFDVKTWWEGLQ